MPELPEVETMRRGILPIEGSKVRQIRRTPCAKKPIQIQPRIDHINRRIRSQEIISVDRLGKRVVLRTEKNDRLVFEPRMTGLVLIGDPPNREHLRVEIMLEGGPVDRLLFWDRRGLGTVTLFREKEFDEYAYHGNLGPDALDVSADELRERFRLSKQAVKVAMLDQKKVLGIGNLYASEILHRCRIDPRTRCTRINKKQWNEIYEVMLDVFAAAIKSEGSTLSDGTYRNALNDPGGYQNYHLVYDREKQACPSCERGKIVRIVQAQRATFYCPKCQKRK